MSDTNKSLQDLFESARNAKPPISKSESQSFIEQRRTDGGEHSQQPRSKFFRKITPMKAFSVVAVTAFTAGSMYYYTHRTPAFDKTAFATNSPAPITATAGDTAKEATIGAPNIERSFKIEIHDNDSSSPASSLINNILFTDNASTFKLFLGALGGSGMKDSLMKGMGDFSHAFDSIKTIFNSIVIDTSAPYGITVRNIPGMGHDTTFDIPDSEHMTRHELVEKLDSMQAVLRNLSNLIALDTSYPGNPAIVVNKRFRNKMTVLNSYNSPEMETYKQTGEGNDSAYKKTILFKSDVIYSKSPSTLKLSIMAMNDSPGDSARKNVLSLQHDKDSIKEQLNQIIDNSTNPDTREFMDSVKTLVEDIAIDSTSPDNPSIVINKQNLNDFSVTNTNQTGNIKIYKTFKLQNGGSSPVMINVNLHPDKFINAGEDSVTLQLNLKNGFVSFTPIKKSAPDYQTKRALEQALLSSVSVDTFSINANGARIMNLSIHCPLTMGSDSITYPLTQSQAAMMGQIRANMNTIKRGFENIPVNDDAGNTAKTILDMKKNGLMTTKNNNMLSVALHTNIKRTTVIDDGTEFPINIFEHGASAGPMDSSILKAFLPYAGNGGDSCAMSIAQTLSNSWHQDSVMREERLAKHQSTTISDISIIKNDVPSDNKADTRVMVGQENIGFYARPGDTTDMHMSLRKNAVQISGTRLITLSAEQLAKLGVVPCKTGVCMYIDNDLFDCIGMNGNTMVRSCDMEGLNRNATPIALTTDDHGIVRGMSYDADKVDSALEQRIDALPPLSQERFALEKQLSDEARTATLERVNMLIPILVKTGREFTAHDRELGYMRPNVIFWYDPTPEFLALLPDSIRVQLSTELAAADSTIHKVEFTLDASDSIGVNPPDISAPPKISTLQLAVTPDSTHSSYFDLWRTASGAITASLVYPNPSNGEFTIEYTLADARTVTATLHDIFGHEIKALGQQSSGAGISKIQVQAEGIAPGIYLIALTTDKGEQAVQRVIIER